MTRFNNKYPYTDFHELNADWLLETVEDAAAEAKEASDTVATYNDRLTTVEGDLAPIKAAMPGLASDVSGLQHDVGIMDSLITNTINPGLDTLQNEVETASTGLLDRMTAAEGSISTLQNEVETPTTGLLDRVTALENAPATTANAVYYLEFDSSLVSIDPDNAYDSRIEYDWLKQFVPLNVSGEDTHVIKLYDSHTQKVYDLAAFHLQESVSPDGKFIFTNRAEHTTGGVVDYYVNSTVTVLQSGTNPTFAEENEIVLPAVTSSDAGDVLTVDNSGNWVAAAPGGGGVSGSFTQGGGVNFDFANYIEYDDYIIINIRGTATSPLNAGATIVTGGPSISNSANAVGVLASNNDYSPICVAYSTNGNIVIRPALSIGDTFYISIMIVK